MAFPTGVDVISSNSFVPWKHMDGNAPVTRLAGIWTLNSYLQDGRLRFVSDRYTGEDAEGSQEILCRLQEEVETTGRSVAVHLHL
jgi:hypothetical protein